MAELEAEMSPETWAQYRALGGPAQLRQEMKLGNWAVPSEAGGEDSLGDELWERFKELTGMGPVPEETVKQNTKKLSDLARPYLALGADVDLLLKAMGVTFADAFIARTTDTPFFQPFAKRWLGNVSRLLSTREARQVQAEGQWERALDGPLFSRPELPPGSWDRWPAVLEALEGMMERQTFRVWFGDTWAEHGDGRVLVYACKEGQRDWLEHRLRPVVEQAVEGVTGEPLEVEFAVRNGDEPTKEGGNA